MPKSLVQVVSTLRSKEEGYPGVAMAGCGVLLLMFFCAHILFLAVGQYVGGFFGVDHWFGAQSSGVAAVGMVAPSWLHTRLLLVCLLVGSAAAAVGFYDLENPALAVKLAALLPALLCTAEYLSHWGDPVLLLFSVQMVITQLLLTAFWVRHINEWAEGQDISEYKEG